MNRVRDYLRFAVRFIGLGYIVMWPFASVGGNGAPFGASLLCADASAGVLRLLCRAPHIVPLPLSLHLLGVLSAVAVVSQALYDCVRHVRARQTADARASELPGAAQPAPRRIRLADLPRVKSRSHFGLRAAPQRANGCA